MTAYDIFGIICAIISLAGLVVLMCHFVAYMIIAIWTLFEHLIDI